MCLLVPEGMAYAQIAGIPPETAFYVAPPARRAEHADSRTLFAGSAWTLAKLGCALVLLVAGFVFLLLLPSPWNLIIFVACIPLFLGELAFWNRTVRHRRVQAGAETLIGKTGTVVSTCRPDGQVRLGGEIWEARCAEGADPGETVTVVSRDDLTLVVERLNTT